jgi:hypothetical protein
LNVVRELAVRLHGLAGWTSAEVVAPRAVRDRFPDGMRHAHDETGEAAR